MDVDNLIRAAILVSLLVGFVGIFLWAWSNKRKEDFELMSRLPLDEDVDLTTIKEKR